MSDLKLALGLVGPNSSDAIPSEAKVEEAFVLTIEAMKVASNLCPEAVEGMPSGIQGYCLTLLINIFCIYSTYASLIRTTNRPFSSNIFGIGYCSLTISFAEVPGPELIESYNVRSGSCVGSFSISRSVRAVVDESWTVVG